MRRTEKCQLRGAWAIKWRESEFIFYLIIINNNNNSSMMMMLDDDGNVDEDGDERNSSYFLRTSAKERKGKRDAHHLRGLHLLVMSTFLSVCCTSYLFLPVVCIFSTPYLKRVFHANQSNALFPFDSLISIVSLSRFIPFTHLPYTHILPPLLFSIGFLLSLLVSWFWLTHSLLLLHFSSLPIMSIANLLHCFIPPTNKPSLSLSLSLSRWLVFFKLHSNYNRSTSLGAAFSSVHPLIMVQPLPYICTWLHTWTTTHNDNNATTTTTTTTTKTGQLFLPSLSLSLSLSLSC